jgi:hypothetical protein
MAGKGMSLMKFDITKIHDQAKVVMIGKTKSGKSYCLRQILSKLADIPVGTVISQTEFANRFYSDFVPSRFIHDDYNPQIIENFLKRQFKVCNHVKNEETNGGRAMIDPRAFLILDDCLSDRASIVNDKNIKYLFYAGRHVKTFFSLCMQYPLGLTPDLRGNIDFVFIFRESNVQNRKRIYDNYAGMFPSFDMFCQVMDQCTQNFECLVIDNTTTSNRLQDQVFWFKADATPPFRMCANEYWLDNKPFKSSLAIANDDEGEDFNPNDARKNKGPIIHVKKQRF